MSGNNVDACGCLCGKVTVLVSKMSNAVGSCHCNMCRRWGGGPLLTVECDDSVSFTGKENIGVFSSSDWAERAFCKSCGTHLYYRLKESGQYFIPAGLFDGDERFVFDHQVFIDEKPAYYCFSNETHNMTGAEVFAKYAP